MALSITLPSTAPTVTGDQALRIALADGSRMYRDLHLYDIRLSHANDGWHVDFEFKETFAQSGGPHYIIDSQSGEIRWKEYEQ